MVGQFYDLIILGGYSDDTIERSIYKLSLGNGIYSWTTLQQHLQIPRASFTAIPLFPTFACNQSQIVNS